MEPSGGGGLGGGLQVLCSVIHLVSLSWGSRARARGPARIGLNAKSKQLSLEFIVRYLTASSAVVFPSSNLRVYSSLYGWRKKKTLPTSLKHNSGLLNHTFLRPACEADRPAADSAHVVSDSLFYTHSTLQIYGCDVLTRCSLHVQGICYRCCLCRLVESFL